MARKLGWIRDLPDHRDHYRMTIPPAVLPAAVDLRPQFPEPPYDQGDYGSCIFNAIAGAMQYQQQRQGFPVWMPSRFFMYFNVREMEGTGSEDAGGQIRDGIKSLNVYGACYEAMWSYEPEHFAAKPTPECYETALNHQSLRYSRIRQYDSYIKATLAEGYPIIFGSTLYQSFMSDEVARTGRVPYPTMLETPIGGHAMLAVGYEGNAVIVRNSWSQHWGDGGYCYMPMDYLCSTNLSDDLWCLMQLE